MTDQRSEDLQAERLDGLLQRVRELEETVHYLSNTLAMHGILNDTEKSVADRMYRGNRIIRSATGDDR
ncbi:hypothetical protein ABZ341_18325 [Streptomyces sp. NPDC006173]|uniref:hypothetical protein n=1 Tax=Streptomyces sp. NPDC006173 TaxID=3155349 RepID=UPI0033EBD439